jgi:hypothetical protein
MNDGTEPVDSFVGLETKTAESESLFQIPVVDFAVPALGIPVRPKTPSVR